MFSKLEEAEKRYSEISERLSDPSVASDRELYKKLTIERKKLEPVIEKYREYRSCASLLAETEEMRGESNDPDFHSMVEEEWKTGRENLASIERELKILLLPRDENDDKNVIMEIRAGAGGDEAALFASRLFRMYVMFAEKHGWRIEEMNVNKTELGGIKEISFSVIGQGAYSRLKYESGVHRVQRVPETESSGRIHTSTATVAVLPEVDEVAVDIDPADLKVESIKSTGAGGQHVNKTESAVRMTHKPTGIVIECREERSQFKNRDKALKMLRAKLYDIKLTERNEKIASERKSQVGTGERCERIRTYNFPQGRVTDHRIGVTIHSIGSFLDGEMDDLLDRLAASETAEKLKSDSPG